MDQARAVLIDLDGTLVLSDDVWKMCERRLLKERDLVSDARLEANIEGLTLCSRIVAMKEYYRLTDSETVLCQELETSLLGSLLQVRSAPGAAKFVNALVKLEFDLAVVSNSSHKLIDAALAGKSWAPSIPLRVSSDDVSEGKPSPLIYELAAKRLGVLPSQCLAVEDSEHGVAASLAAGMTCIGLANTANAWRIRALTPNVAGNLNAALPLLLKLAGQPDSN